MTRGYAPPYRRGASGHMHDGLPVLPEPTRPQLFLAGLSIVVALLLLAAVAIRLSQRIDLMQWWVPAALVAGVVAADFLSGLLHWSADTWGRAELPVIGPRFLVPFRVHHLNPDDFIARRFVDTNGDVAALTVPALGGLLVLPLDTMGQQAFGIACLGLCALGGMTNQIHQWAHMPV